MILDGALGRVVRGLRVELGMGGAGSKSLS